MRDASAYEIRVRGEGKLFADVQAAGTALQISGVLRDEIGDLLPQRTILLEVRPRSGDESIAEEELITDMRGRFRWQRELDEGTYQVTLTFRPTQHLDGSRVRQAVELRAIPPDVSMHVPEVAIGTGQPITLRVRASAASIGVSTPVEVWVRDEFVASLELDEYGRGAMDIGEFLTPGENAIVARLPATSRRPGADDDDEVRFAESATLTAAASISHRRLERGLMVAGEVADPLGPLPSGGVRVTFSYLGPPPGRDAEDFAGEGSTPVQRKHRVEAQVGDNGTFEGFLPGVEAVDGRWRAEVVYRPDAGAALKTKTEVVVLDRSGSRWILNLLGALAVLLGLFVLAQRLSTVEFAEWLRAMRHRLRRDPYTVEEEPIDLQADEPITVEAMDALTQQDIPEGTHHISGVVWDGWRNTPVPHAVLSLSRGRADGEPEHCIHADGAGAFSSPELQEGAWHLRVTAPGYARGTLDFTIPHEGALRYFRLGMVAVPLKIRRFYRHWVRRIRGEDLWGRLSPRQIEGAIWEAFDETAPRLATEQRRAQLRAELRALLDAQHAPDEMDPERLLLTITEIVEESYFSARLYDEELWHLLVAVAEHLDHTLHDVTPPEEVRR